MKAEHSASSSDEIAVFQAYTDLINSERETLWARHNALLLANSLIIVERISANTPRPVSFWPPRCRYRISNPSSTAKLPRPFRDSKSRSLIDPLSPRS
jgi:hypothetical protein